jgi:hypothetical protein
MSSFVFIWDLKLISYGLHDATAIAQYLKVSLKPLMTNTANQTKVSKAIQKITDNHACQFLLAKLTEICDECPWKELVLQPMKRRAKALKFQFQIHKALQEENARLKVFQKSFIFFDF